MNPFLKWYLIGALIALLINLIIMATSHKVKVSNILGYVLNTFLSWGCLATFFVNMIVELLEKRHWNKTLWTSAEYKKQMEKLEKEKRYQHPSLKKH